MCFTELDIVVGTVAQAFERVNSRASGMMLVGLVLELAYVTPEIRIPLNQLL